MRTIVLEVRCENEECGMVSAFRFWEDGSFQKILEACYHAKRLPKRSKIIQDMELENESHTAKSETLATNEGPILEHRKASFTQAVDTATPAPPHS